MKQFLFNLFLSGALIAMAIPSSCTNSQSGKEKTGDNIMNETLQTIFARTSVRSYSSEPISQDTLEMIVKAGMAAPTGMNRQPWQFVVVSGDEAMKSLSEKIPQVRMLKEAAAAIVVLGNPEISDNWMLDCSAATENILLAAQSMGIGAVWTAGYPYPDRIAPITAALNIPSPWIPLCLIPMGYPSGENTPKDKWDPAKVHYNGW